MSIHATESEWASPPWDTIADILREKQIDVDEFEAIIGKAAGFAEGLRSGAQAIDAELALTLSKNLGASERFWLKRESDFRIALSNATQHQDSAPFDWLRELPLKDMIASGWLGRRSSKREMLQEVLSFFGLSNFNEWEQRYGGAMNSVAFRKSAAFNENTLSTVVWLRQGERQAKSMLCERWNPATFADLLPSIRPLMRQASPAVFIPKLKQICARAGVSVVIVKVPEGCRASGAARIISPERAIIQLSFRYLSDDHFWFTFFHEAGHLVLHNENHLFLENNSGIMGSEEAEANLFAENFLIPDHLSADLPLVRPFKRDVIKFAYQAGTSPGIVVGQMQHKGILTRNRLNFLKRRYDWSDVLDL